MEIKPSDGGDLIGTPLEPVSSNPPNLRHPSPGDLMAPPTALFHSLAVREAEQHERALITSAAIEAARPVNLDKLHRRGKGASTLYEIMDDEDRANLASRGRVKNGEGLVPFAAAATGVVEILPKPRTMSVGWAMLRRGRELAGKAGIRVAPDVDNQQLGQEMEGLYRLSEMFAYARRQKADRHGSGYEGGQNGSDGQRRMEEARISRKGGKLVVVNRTDGLISHGNGDDSIDELANAGYKNLDAAVDRASVSMLKQRRLRVEKLRNEEKRSAHIAGLEDRGRPLFQQFGEPCRLEYGLRKPGETGIAVPPEFAANPRHDFENDPFKSKGSVLPEAIQKEYDALVEAQRENLDDERRAVNATIAHAKEKREERLRRVRAKFLQDMGSKFVRSGESVGSREQHGDFSKGASGVNLGAEEASTGNVGIVGKNARTVLAWSPAPLLCKRFGLQTANKGIGSGTSKSHLLGVAADSPPCSEDEDEHEDEDFQVHAIIGADGQRIDFRDAVQGLIDDDSVVLTTAEPKRVISAKRSESNPSRELYSVIFNESTTRAEQGSKATRSLSPDEPAADTRSDTRAGLHKTRAADFF